MAKIVIWVACLVLGYGIFANDDIILKIGNNTITKNDIELEKSVIDNLFRDKYNRLPGVDDKKLLSSLEFELKQKKLASLLISIIKKDIKHRYFDKVVTQDAISQYIKTYRKNVHEDITRHTMFLEAADYIEKSTDQDKYRVAYDKYKKLGLINSYSFFKSAVTNKAYLEQLKQRINNLSKNILSDGEKNMIFEQELPRFITNELSMKDEKIKTHLLLAREHKCNYEESLYMHWFIEQGRNLGVEIFDARYGNSLSNILSADVKEEK